MPIYIYQHEETKEIREIVQSMNEEHVYNGENNNEQGKWKRVFCNPNMGVDLNCDPYSESIWLQKTSKKDKLKNILDRSKELSLRRAKMNNGVDPIKEKYYENWSKKRKGKIHPDKIKNCNIEIDLAKWKVEKKQI